MGGQVRPNWDAYFLVICNTVAIRSDCTRRKVGAVIVRPDHSIASTGYNGAPRGEPGCTSAPCPRSQFSYAELPRSASYSDGPGRCIAVHAEANAIAQSRETLTGYTMYCSYAPCVECQKLIAKAGIVRVITYETIMVPAGD